jgi:hypothetical protein
MPANDYDGLADEADVPGVTRRRSSTRSRVPGDTVRSPLAWLLSALHLAVLAEPAVAGGGGGSFALRPLLCTPGFALTVRTVAFALGRVFTTAVDADADLRHPPPDPGVVVVASAAAACLSRACPHKVNAIVMARYNAVLVC